MNVYRSVWRTVLSSKNKLCRTGLNLHSVELLKSMRCGTVANSRVLLQRKYSRQPRNLKLLSDIEEYVEHDFVLQDLKKKFDEANLPALVTTSSLLEQCQDVSDILVQLRNAINGGKLWMDELVLYTHALMKVTRSFALDSSANDLVGDDMSVNKNAELLNDPYFQFLMKEILLHSARFTTFDLVHIFYSFVILRLPVNSNVMSLLVTIIQRRINELFPSDVLKCFIAINNIGTEQTPLVGSLYSTLFMHLENQIVDEHSFARVLIHTPLIHQLRLLRHIGGLGSGRLKATMWHSIMETVKQRSDRRLHSVHEACAVLIALKVTRKSQSKYMLHIATKFFLENEELLNDDHRALINDTIVKLRLTEGKSVRELRAVCGS